MTHDLNILAIPERLAAPAVSYVGLPDESAVLHVAELHDIAQACGQPFQLESFDRLRHPRGYCLGISKGSTPIAIFYVAESGIYAWALTSCLHVASLTAAQRWLPQPLKVGMNYWFRASDFGDGHAKAEPVGPAGPLKTHYWASHTPPPNNPVIKKSKAKDDEAGDSPALRPQLENSEFMPIKSLGELGL